MVSYRDYISPVQQYNPNTTQYSPSTSGLSPEVVKLAQQVNEQKLKIQAQTGRAADSGGGLPIVSRLFDVISRPLYTVANAVDYSVEGKNPFEGAMRGLSGQDKTTFDKVLGDLGMSGGFQRSLLGLGLDVAGDPTTYIGGGLVKGITEGAAKTAASEIAIESSEKLLSKEAVNLAAKNIVKEGTVVTGKTAVESTEKIAKTILNSEASDVGSLKTLYSSLPEKEGTVVQTVTKKEALKIARNQAQDKVAQLARETEDKLMQEGRGKVFLKVFGKKTNLLPEKLGQDIYSVGTKISDVAGRSQTLRKLGQAFRPVMNYPMGTNSLLREATGHALFDGEEYIRLAKSQFGHLGEGEREMITHALESGADLSAHKVIPKEIPLTADGTKATFNNLEDYKKLAQDKLNALYQNEVDLGILKESDALHNYVPHIYGTSDRTAARAFKAERQQVQKAFKLGEKGLEKNPNPVVKSLKEAQDAGLKPETDFLKILGYRSIDSFKDQAGVRFAHAVEGEFGLHLGTNKNAKSLANKLGLVEGDSKYLSGKGIYFHPEVSKTLKSVNKMATDPAAGSELLKLFDKTQQAWKLNMTALNPGHHMRNFFGDVFLNFEDGLSNPARYTESAKILKSWREAPESVVIHVGERKLNAGEVMQLFSSHGGKAGFFRTELSASKFKPVEAIREAAETREDWTRLAHFIDVMKKEGTDVKTIQDLDRVATEAGQRVRKFNIDYADLTPFEQKTMKRVVPFYTWMRKNIPIQIESLALQPGKVNVVPKFMNFLSNATGQKPPELFGLNLTPLWLRQIAGVRIAGEGQGRNGSYWDPSIFPIMDIPRFTEGGVQGILSNALGATTPFARMPIELAFGRSLLTGGPLPDTGRGYIGSSILPPQWAKVAGMISGQDEIAGVPTGSKGPAIDIAKLLGLSIQPVGDQQYLGELRRQQDPLQAQLHDLKQKAIAEYQRTHGG